MSGPASWSTLFTAVPLYRLRILYADSAPATSYRIIETCDCGRMADHGHSGVGATVSERHVEGRHPTAVGGGLPCDRSRRPTAPIIYEPCVDVW